MRGAVSLAAVLLVSIAAIAMVALSYTAVKTPTRTTPSAQTGRCFWIDAEFEKRADGLGYDPYVIFRSDDGSGFDDIYLTRDGALVAGPNRWNKSNGPFVFYPQYTGGILRAGQTISYNGRDDNCGARGNSSTIACSVDQNGNLVETGSCKSRGGGGNQPPPTAIPTQPQSNNPQVCSGNTCNDCILTERDDILTYYRDTGGWDISCSNQTAIVNNWCGIDPTGCSIVKLNECAQQCGVAPTATPTKPVGAVPTATPTKPVGAAPTKTPTPIPSNTPIPTATPTVLPTPATSSCGYFQQDCCPAAKQYCEDPALVCGGYICLYPTLIPSNTPVPTTTPKPTAYTPPQQEKFAAPLIQTGQQIINKLTGREATPTPQQQIQQNLSISGTVKVNNSLGIPIVETKTALYKTKGDPGAIAADASGGSYQYNNIPPGEYFIKAWVRDQNGNWYQNAPCSPIGDDYDCSVKPGEKENLVVNIGPQGLRGLFIQSQNISTNFAENLRQAIINLPGGSFINMFLMTAF